MAEAALVPGYGWYEVEITRTVIVYSDSEEEAKYQIAQAIQDTIDENDDFIDDPGGTKISIDYIGPEPPDAKEDTE